MAGIDAHLDQRCDDGRRDWSAWFLDQLRLADFIMVVASLAYCLRADADGESAQGRGARFEAAVLRDRLTMDQTAETRRIMPVVLRQHGG